jgi:D-arabinose 1-dehydrogenase-like Zn-dependent alcohol dehydrogenase
MKAAIFQGPGAVEAGERPDPVIQEPTDAVVRVVLGAGADVRNVSPGDLVVAPFIYSDMTSPHCRNGSTISCRPGQLRQRHHRRRLGRGGARTAGRRAPGAGAGLGAPG